MQINVEYDPDVANAPADFKAAVTSAVNYLDSLITNNITVTIEFGWGSSGPLQANQAGEAANSQTPWSYLASPSATSGAAIISALEGAYQANGLSAQITPAVLAADFQALQGDAGLGFSYAQAQALGIGSDLGAGPSVGYVALNSNDSWNFDLNSPGSDPNALDAVSALIHEITHVLGRTAGTGSDASYFDLFRYDSSGALHVAPGGGFFSLNGGNLTLPFEPANVDPSDWTSTVQNDANGFAPLGAAYNVSPVDLVELQALGFQLSSPAQLTPYVAGFAYGSNGGFLGAGAAVSITLQLSETVSVTGSPTLTLNDGGTATYAGGSGTNALTFDYVVGAGDAQEPSLGVSALNLNGASITDAAGQTLSTSLAGLTATGPGIEMPVVVGQNVSVAANQAVAASALIAQVANPNNDNITGYEFWDGGVGNGHLSVGGVAQPDGQWIIVTSDQLSNVQYVGGASGGVEPIYVAVYDAASGTWTQPATVNATTTGGAPVVTALAETPAAGTLGAGAAVTFTLDFNEAVTVTGAPSLALNDGGVATYVGGSGANALTFAYKVGAGDTSVPALTATGVNLNGGTISDGVGDSANLSLQGVSQTGPQINSAVTTPVLSGVQFSAATGALGVGSTETITLAFSEAVTVSGTPTLQLSDGATAAYSGGSGSSALTFSYVVGAGDANTSALSVAGVTGAIDNNGVPADLSLSGLAQSGPAVNVGGPHVAAIFETPASGDLAAGTVVTFALDWNEAVTVTGSPVLALAGGGQATLADASGHILDFTYTVGAGGATQASLLPTGLQLDGGVIQDAAGNAAAGLALAGLSVQGELSLGGGTGAQTLSGGEAFAVGSGGANLTGGSGVNTAVFSGAIGQYDLSDNGGVVTVIDHVGGRDGTSTLNGVQQAEFSDVTLVFDLHSSQDLLVYELYQAAFNRMPDNAGLRYWAGVADANHTSAIGLADAFLAAPEFSAKYGTDLSNLQYVTELYANVLGRQPDQAGLNYWVGQANAGQAHDQLLVDFATSAENVNLIGSHVSDGLWTTH